MESGDAWRLVFHRSGTDGIVATQTFRHTRSKKILCDSNRAIFTMLYRYDGDQKLDSNYDNGIYNRIITVFSAVSRL